MTTKQKGYIYVVGAYVLWGLLPLFWRLLSAPDPIEVLSHRIVWSFAILAVLLRKDRSRWEYLKTSSGRLPTLLAALTVALNWGVYIYGVNAGFVVESSLGYYINPLMMIVLAILVFKEKLDVYRWLAFGLATLGVLCRTFFYGKIPVVALLLAVTFGMYGFIKKRYHLEAHKSLLAEMSYLLPLSLGYIIFLEIQGEGYLFRDFPRYITLFILAGVATTLPFFLYADGLKKIPLVSVGFIQFIGPTLMLLVGVFAFGEPFDTTSLISFGLIWLGCLVYMLGTLRFREKST